VWGGVLCGHLLADRVADRFANRHFSFSDDPTDRLAYHVPKRVTHEIADCFPADSVALDLANNVGPNFGPDRVPICVTYHLGSHHVAFCVANPVGSDSVAVSIANPPELSTNHCEANRHAKSCPK